MAIPTDKPKGKAQVVAPPVTKKTAKKTVKGSASTQQSTTAPVATQAEPVDFASSYGVQAALVNSNPELQQLFNQAVAEKWTAAKFQAAFMNTGWYKNNSDTWRSAETTRLSDPASWKEQQGIASNIIRRQAIAMGFELDEDQISKLADQSLYLAGGSANNIDANSLKSSVVEVGRITGKGGTSLQIIDKLKADAFANGISYNDGWFEGAAKDILSGTGTIDAWNKQIKDAAKSKYAALAPQIDAGLSVRDIASPYLQEMAGTLELDPNTLTLDDPLMQRALTGLNDKNEPYLTPLWQFQRELKQDDRYFKTNKANQEFTGLATEIARQFGKTV